MIGEKWMIWAVGEGVTKAGQWMCYKRVGGLGRTVDGALMVILVSGLIQTVGGLIGARARGIPLLPTRGQLVGCVVFGLFASTMMTLAVVTFTFEGADVGVTTFLVTTSIIPGAFIDWIFFAHPLQKRQWLGVGAFLAAGYCMLDFPSVVVL